MSKLLLNPLSILLIDDDRMCRRILEVFLKQLGHDADMAENAEEALEAIAKKRYDVIFLDIGLPNISGIELAKIIRCEYNMDVTLVATTGHVLDADQNRYTCAGIDLVLEKPLSLERIELFLSEYALEADATP
jgi:CheY-like chemotaxis protein